MHKPGLVQKILDILIGTPTRSARDKAELVAIAAQSYSLHDEIAQLEEENAALRAELNRVRRLGEK